MNNPFDRATEISINHPKKVLAIGFVSTLLLSSMAMFLEFDNSEDAFFPDNETVRLLDEVESECKWGLLTLALLLRRADGAAAEPEVGSLCEQLVRLDPAHTAFFRHLADPPDCVAL